MSNCSPCIKINPLPECIEDAYNPYYMEGLVFVDADTNIIARVRNTATGRITYIDVTTDEDGDALIDLTPLFPLLNHVYEMHFGNTETGNPEQFTITNADSTTSTGCCLEFTINPGQVDTNGFFVASTQMCAV